MFSISASFSLLLPAPLSYFGFKGVFFFLLPPASIIISPIIIPIINPWSILSHLFSHPPIRLTPGYFKEISGLLLFIEFSIITSFISDIPFASFTNLLFLGTVFFIYMFLLLHDSEH